MGFRYVVAEKTKSQLYEALEPHLNGGRVLLLDVPLLEQQLLGLVWRGGNIDHQAGEHDDFANAAAGLVRQLTAGVNDARAAEVARWCLAAGADEEKPFWRAAAMLASDEVDEGLLDS